MVRRQICSGDGDDDRASRVPFAGNIRLDGAAQVLALKLSSSDNQALTAGLLFLRGVSSFQGTVLLAERGMTGDARTLVRPDLRGRGEITLR
jgi:hypothetical protein